MFGKKLFVEQYNRQRVSRKKKEVNNQNKSLLGYGVCRLDKPEKICALFDAAAKFQGISPTQIFHVDPDLTNHLVGALLRFRRERIAWQEDM